MTLQKATLPLILMLFSAIAMGQVVADRPTNNNTTIWKQKTELSTLGLWGAGHFWALKKDADINKSRSSLGFRLETLGEYFLLAPTFDLQKVHQRGKINPLLGFQVGSGILGDLEPYLEDWYVAVTPYAGVNIPIGGGVELDIAFQYRFNFFFYHDNFLIPSLGFGMKF